MSLLILPAESRRGFLSSNEILGCLRLLGNYLHLLGFKFKFLLALRTITIVALNDLHGSFKFKAMI